MHKHTPNGEKGKVAELHRLTDFEREFNLLMTQPCFFFSLLFNIQLQCWERESGSNNIPCACNLQGSVLTEFIE